MAAYQRAPEAVRNVFNGEVTANVIMDMKTRYRLHVDVAGNLGAEVGYMLLGLRSPAEFFGNLMLSGTDQETAKAMMEEVNTRIFIPLKSQMRGETQDAAPVSYQAPAPVAAPVPVVPVPTLEYAPAAPTLPGSPVPAPMPISPAPEAPVSAPAPQMAAPVVAQPAAPAIPPAAEIPPVPLKKDYGADPYREPIT